jgi:epoxyqueuosine reductase
MIENLSENIATLLIDNGASLVGFADITELPSPVRKNFPYAVSIAAVLNSEIIAEIKNGPTTDYCNEYKRVNALLTELCHIAAAFLTEKGFGCYRIAPTTEDYNPVTISARFQHKTAATRAGIGWIGKSALVITKQFGAAVRLATVLTDAALTCGTPINTSYCDTCEECVRRCPAGAITGNSWQVGMAREELYNASLCRKKCRELSRKESIPSTVCGICINVCPWTRKRLKWCIEK